MNSRLLLLPSLSLLIGALASRPALAQGTQNPGPPSQGPMIVERVKSGFLVAPDFKVTEVDHNTGELIGAYAGWLIDQTFFIGGGGYWLANQSGGDRDMGYGGLVVQWVVRAKEPIGFSVKGLVGGGATTASTTISRPIPVDFRGGRGDGRPGTATITTARFRTETGFFVFEPEVNVLIRLTRQMRLTAGAGYRLIAAEYGDDSRLRGAVGSVGIQIGGGS